jgi:creatinine amidohydrolase
MYLYPAKPYLVASAHWYELQNFQADLTVLPWGALEAHNYHLPYGTDTMQCEYIVHQAAERAWAAGHKPMVLPAIPFGVQSAQKTLPMHIHIKPSTQFSLLSDIVASLESQGQEKLIIVNGHGANSFVAMIRELFDNTKMKIFILNWYDCLDAHEYFTEPGDHAGEMETSLIQYITPHLALPLDMAGAGQPRKANLNCLNRRYVWTQRDWLKTSTDTGVGDPKLADPNKGKAYLNAVIALLTDVFNELSALDIQHMYDANSEVEI